jgi:hypothetical protein
MVIFKSQKMEGKKIKKDNEDENCTNNSHINVDPYCHLEVNSYPVIVKNRSFKPVFLKVVYIDPQGSMRTSKGSTSAKKKFGGLRISNGGLRIWI